MLQACVPRLAKGATRADPRDANCGLSRGEAAVRCALRAQKFSGPFGTQPAERTPEADLRDETRRDELAAQGLLVPFGTQPAEHAYSDTNCGPQPGGDCGPPMPDGIDSFRGRPAAERMGLHERTCGTRSCSPPPGGGCGLPVLRTDFADKAPGDDRRHAGCRS